MRYIPFFLVSALLIISCKKESTVWETDWSAPLINDTLSLSNLVNDSTLTESGGFYNVDLNRSLFDMNINELVEIPDTNLSGEYTIAFPSITVEPDYTFVDSDKEFILAVADIELKEIIVKKGFIDINVRNPAGTKAFFKIDLPGISKDGVAFIEDFVADAGSNSNPGLVSRTVDLTGYKIDFTGSDGTKRNTLLSGITVKSDPDGPTVILYNTDIVKMEVILRDVEIDYARGYFGNQVVSDTTDIDLEILNMIQSGALDLPASTIKFEISNGVKVSASALLSTVVNENSNGTSVALTHPQIGVPFVINPATGSWASLSPSQKLIVFDDGNSNIESFLENLGGKNSVGYRIELNPWGNVTGGNDQIFPGSRLSVNLHANLPLKLGTDALVVRDTFDIDFSQNTAKTHVTAGDLMLKLSNSFPFSADVKLVMLDANKNVLHTINGSSKIESGQFGTMDPTYNLKVANSSVNFVLSDAVIGDIDLIKFIIVQSQFDSVNPTSGVNEAVNIPVGAFLAVKLRTRFTTSNQF
ncbi:MAG: hypothetical protein ACI837_002435 [Crocinitomicaceae bacterium]|jgi:hypothetical protein